MKFLKVKSISNVIRLKYGLIVVIIIRIWHELIIRDAWNGNTYESLIAIIIRDGNAALTYGLIKLWLARL